MDGVTKRSRVQGTTLVELMIVVVIIGILAAIATVGYKRYVGRARLAEANSMLAEFAAKEQLYFMEAGAYAPVRRDGFTSLDENKQAFLPIAADTSDPTFESVRTSHDVPNPYFTSWRTIGLRLGVKQLYCTYMVNAGGAADTLPTGIGSRCWASTPPVPWFYAVAACNLNTADDSLGVPTGLPANATFLVLTHDTPGVHIINDGH
jgi:prepilin-type N-terminal cleavage/methylation domain-containing protein